MCRYVTDGARVSRIGVANPTSSLEALVDADPGTLVTALYVKIDDALVKTAGRGTRPASASPGWSAWRSSSRCWASAASTRGSVTRRATCGAFPCLPRQPGCNKRLRAALPLIK
jgi:hypothetical protein